MLTLLTSLESKQMVANWRLIELNVRSTKLKDAKLQFGCSAAEARAQAFYPH